MDTRQAYFRFRIDADPDAFGVILNWLRTKKMMLTDKTSLEMLEVAADFYELHELKKEVEMRIQEEKKKDLEKKEDLEKIHQELEALKVEVKHVNKYATSAWQEMARLLEVDVQ